MKRAKKLGAPPVSYTIGNKVFVERRKFAASKAHEGEFIAAFNVEVFGENPNINGWKFIAKLEHLDGTSRPKITGLDSGEALDRYSDCTPDCDHCKSSRKRVSTYILKNIETGEFKQIGRTCLDDFFGEGDPLAVAAYSEMLREVLGEFIVDPEFLDEVNSKNIAFTAQFILALALAIIGDGSYISSAKAEAFGILSTGDIIKGFLNPKSRSTRPSVTDAHHEKAKEIIAWVASEDVRRESVSSVYFNNLIAIFECGFVSSRDVGLVASSIAMKQRADEKKLALDADLLSNHIGVAGEKVSFIARLDRIIHMQGMFTSYLHSFSDETGNRITWKTSSPTYFKIGHPYHLTATIKGHDSYRDVKQTQVLRVSAPDTEIFKHIISADSKKFLKCLKSIKNIDVIEPYEPHRTAVMVAAAHAQVDMVAALIAAGADVNALDADGIPASAYLENVCTPAAG